MIKIIESHNIRWTTPLRSLLSDSVSRAMSESRALMTEKAPKSFQLPTGLETMELKIPNESGLACMGRLKAIKRIMWKREIRKKELKNKIYERKILSLVHNRFTVRKTKTVIIIIKTAVPISNP